MPNAHQLEQLARQRAADKGWSLNWAYRIIARLHPQNESDGMDRQAIAFGN